MIFLTENDYNAISPDYRSVWTTERTDLKDWDTLRDQMMGKRTMMVQGCSLLIEDQGFKIVKKGYMAFVIDPTVEFDGTSYSTMTIIDGRRDRVDYTGYLYKKDKTQDMTLQEYRDYKGNQNLIAISDEEMDVLFQKYEKSLEKPWAEITEAEYWDALECLPPCKWHDLNSRFNSFFISEAYTGSLHRHCIKDRKTDKYYSALRCRFIKDKELIEQLEKL